GRGVGGDRHGVARRRALLRRERGASDGATPGISVSGRQPPAGVMAAAKGRIVFHPGPSAAARATGERGGGPHHVRVTHLPDYYPLAFLLRDAAGEVLGGVLGDIWGGWLHVSFLWVARPLRQQGWARRLMRAAERYAVERGAHDAHLETFSFQARPLYEKLGYEVFAQLDDFPPGHTKYFLRKRLKGNHR